MKTALRIALGISLLAYIYALFSTYSHIAPHISVSFFTESFRMSRDAYFYASLFFLAVVNCIFFLFSLSISRVPNRLLLIPNKVFWTSTTKNRKSVNEILKNWNLATLCTIHYFFIYFMTIVLENNHFEGGRPIYSTWFYFPGLIMAVFLITPIIRLLVNNANLLSRPDSLD